MTNQVAFPRHPLPLLSQGPWHREVWVGVQPPLRGKVESVALGVGRSVDLLAVTSDILFWLLLSEMRSPC